MKSCIDSVDSRNGSSEKSGYVRDIHVFSLCMGQKVRLQFVNNVLVSRILLRVALRLWGEQRSPFGKLRYTVASSHADHRLDCRIERSRYRKPCNDDFGRNHPLHGRRIDSNFILSNV